ncbi:MAG: hypothetical protein VYA34_13720 [Myxococcota bacterium]|nr:hypothetical protein [Myxococcota bacterium]
MKCWNAPFTIVMTLLVMAFFAMGMPVIPKSEHGGGMKLTRGLRGLTASIRKGDRK